MRVPGQAHLAGDAGLRVGDGPCEIAPAHAEAHRREARGVLAEDARGARDRLDVRELAERDLRALGRGDEDLAQRAQVAAEALRPAHHHVEVLLPLVQLRHGRATHRSLDDRFDVADVEPVAPASRAVGRDAHVGLPEHLLAAQVGDARHAGKRSRDLLRLLFVHGEVGPDHLDGVLALDAAHRLFDVVRDVLAEAESDAGERLRQLGAELVGQRRFGHALAPLARGARCC